MTALESARRHALPIATVFLLTAPLVVGCVALSAQDWAPIYDMALIEQRLRDVGTVHTPLIGLPGRLGTLAEPACHPGPLSFWLLAPGYRVFGSSAWALYASAALLNAIAVATFVFVVWRRRSPTELAAASAGLGVLMLGYGPTMLVEPWNPHFPVLWFAVFLVAGWGVARRDLAMLPTVAVTASIAAQTHIPYLPVCGPLGAICAAIAVVSTIRAAEASAERKRGIRALAITAALLLIAWLPVLVEELRGAPGNVTRLLRYFRDPSSVPIGFGPGLSTVVSRLNARALAVDPWITPGGFGPTLYPEPDAWSAVTLVLWLVSALAAVVLRSRLLWTLHATALVALGVAVMAASRIVGFPFGHVLFWVWGIAILLVVTCAATLGMLLARKLPRGLLTHLARVGPALALGGIALCALRLGWEARKTRPAVAAQGKLVRALALETITAMHQRKGLATGSSGRYLVSWSDPLSGSALGMSLANELERAGFEVAYDRGFTYSGAHRTRDRAWASARIHLAAGGWIAEGRHARGAVLISRVDVRTGAEAMEARNLEALLIQALRKDGREDLVRRMPYDLPGAVAANPKQDPFAKLLLGRLIEIGWPAAVFIMPPQAVLVRTLTR
jgi:hypothetical protein